MAVYSFLEEYDFGAKTIIPFITHGGSRASRTVNTISELQPGALIMGDELVLSRSDVAESDETVVNWAQGLGINAKAELPQNGRKTMHGQQRNTHKIMERIRTIRISVRIL